MKGKKMSKSEKSAIDAILGLKKKKNTKQEEKMARLKAEKAKVEARIRKQEAEARAKQEKAINLIFDKIAKEIKLKTGIVQFLKKDAQFLSEEELNEFLEGIIVEISNKVNYMKEKIKNYELKGDNDGTREEKSKFNNEFIEGVNSSSL
jgi:hypothetical protein